MRRAEIVARAFVSSGRERRRGAISGDADVAALFASKAYVRDATNKNTHESNVDYAAAVFCCISFPPSPAPAPAALAASRSLNLV